MGRRCSIKSTRWRVWGVKGREDGGEGSVCTEVNREEGKVHRADVRRSKESKER